MPAIRATTRATTLSLAAVAGALAILAPLHAPAHAQTWSAAGDFSGTQNPIGPWCYGTRATAVSDAFSLLAAQFSDSGGGTTFAGWNDPDFSSLSTPVVYKNTGGADFASGTLAIPAGTLVLHPGPDGFGPEGSRTVAVVRWIAPQNALIDIAGAFVGLDSSGSRDVHVVVNGQSLFSTIAGGNATRAFDLENIAVLEGDVVDFAVGTDGSFFFDSTGLDATITVVPAPGALAALGALGLLATRRRRA
jgi:hypothetical protein